jgi:hypothetical protein
MTVRNGEPYLEEAVASILGQSYPDFRFLILDNASTDHSREIIRGFNDPRIDLVELPQDLGQVPALNRGLELIDSPFIARMDADDVSLPQRLERQVEILERNPEMVLVGSSYYIIDGAGNQQNIRWRPTSDTDIRWRMLFYSVFAHPSVLLRAEVLRRNSLRYDPSYAPSEDYHLWSQLLRYGRGQNIREPLLKVRTHPGQSSNEGSAIQVLNRDRISLANIRRLGPGEELSEADIKGVCSLYLNFQNLDSPNKLEYCHTLFKLLQIFQRQPEVEPAEVQAIRQNLTDQVLRAIPWQRHWYLWQSGLLWYMLNNDPRAVIAHPPKRVARWIKQVVLRG